MKLVIVTGASQGLGEAIVRQLLGEADTRVVAISRTENKALLAEAEGKAEAGAGPVAETEVQTEARSEVQTDVHTKARTQAEAGSKSEAKRVAAHTSNRLNWIPYDLVQADGLEQLMDRVFIDIIPSELESVYLINNAGIVQPIAPADRCSAEEITHNVQLNLIAPMVLTAAFIRHTAACQGDKAVLNISSGAGRKPYEGWSSYCSSKAGLDMFTRCVGLEQMSQAYPVRVLSIAPGVVDTAMQQVIRSTDPNDFSQHARFVELKQSGQLLTPEAVAEKLLKVMTDPGYTTGSFLDVRTLKH